VAPPPPAPPAPLAPPAAPDAPGVTASEDGKVRILRIERVGTGEGKQRKVERRVILHNSSSEDRARLEKEMGEGKRVKRHVIVRDGRYIRDGREMTAEERAEFDRDMAEMRKDLAEMHKELGESRGQLQRELDRELGKHSEFQKEMREKFGENGEFRPGMRLAIAEAHAGARAGARAAARAPQVTVQCRQGQKEVTETVVGRDGKQRIFVCSSLATDEARRALTVARAEIARTRELTESQRAEALRSLDQAERESRAD
jgi:bla regulator protein blaR1